MANLFFEPLLGKNFSQEGNPSLLYEFKEALKKGNIVYYPSSGFDLNDIQYINSRRFPDLTETDPDIFVHSDLLHIDTNAYERQRWRDFTREFRINILGSYIFRGNDDKNIEIHKLTIANTPTVKWLLFFRGFLNEEALASLLQNKIKLPIIYTYCDGITHGMGGFEESIPTLFYPLIAKEFGIKHIITEQSIDGFFYGVFAREIEYLRRWIKNILRLTGSTQFKSLLKLDDLKFRQSLHQALMSVPEYSVNSDQRKKLFVWGEPIGMVLKTPENGIMDILSANIEENSKVEQITEKKEEEKEVEPEQVNNYNDELVDPIYSQDIGLLEILPGIGKIPYQIKNHYRTIDELLFNNEIISPLVGALRQRIIYNKDIATYLMSQLIRRKLHENVPVTDFADELKLFIENAYGILPSEEDLLNWNRLQFSDYSKLLLPKCLKRMLEHEQPSKLQIVCTDNFSFLRINGMTENKLNDFIEFRQTLFESENIKVMEKLSVKDAIHLDYDYEQTLTENIERYRDRVVDHIKQYHLKYFNKYRDQEIRNLSIFNTYFKEQTHLNYKQTGEIYNLTAERIRVLFTEKKGRPYNIFKFIFESTEKYLLDLSGNLADEIKLRLSSGLYNPGFGVHLEANPQNYETLSKYLGLFGFELAQFHNNSEIPYYVLIEPEIYGITKFKHFNRELFQLMKNSPYSLTLEEIVEKLTTKFTVDEGVLETVLKFKPYQCAEHEDGTLKYNIQPNLLGSLMLKVERLLYRNEDNMSSDQILEELNMIQRNYEDDEYTANQLIIKSNRNVISFGNNTWIHSEYWHHAEREVPSVFIENQIITNGGKISYAEVIEAIRNNHYNIKDSSVRAYIMSFCRTSKDDLNLFVHKDYVNEYPEIKFHPVRNQLIGRAMLEAYKIASEHSPQFTKEKIQNRVWELLSEENRDERQIKLYFRNLSEKEYFLEHNGIYMVNPEKNIANIKYRKEPQYKTLIRAFIVQDLKANPEGLTLKSLRSKYKENIPEGVSINNFYKFFHNGHLFEKFRLDNIEYVKLVPEYLPEAQPANINTIEPEADERAAVGHGLEYVEGRAFNREELMVALQEKLEPYFISENHYVRSFNKFVEQMEDLTNGSITLHYLFKVFVLKTDHYERFAFLGNIVNFYEPYLKSLNFEPNNQYERGLGNIIRSNGILGNLRMYERDMKHRPAYLADSRKLYFSKSLNSLMHYRNLKDHDLTSELLLEENINIVELISQFVALYMYTCTEVYQPVA